jgi:hypothetical protein
VWDVGYWFRPPVLSRWGEGKGGGWGEPCLRGTPPPTHHKIPTPPPHRSSHVTASKLAAPNTVLGYSLCLLNLAFDGYTNAIQASDIVGRAWGGALAGGRAFPNAAQGWAPAQRHASTPNQSATLPPAGSRPNAHLPPSLPLALMAPVAERCPVLFALLLCCVADWGLGRAHPAVGSVARYAIRTHYVGPANTRIIRVFDFWPNQYVTNTCFAVCCTLLLCCVLKAGCARQGMDQGKPNGKAQSTFMVLGRRERALGRRYLDRPGHVLCNTGCRPCPWPGAAPGPTARSALPRRPRPTPPWPPPPPPSPSSSATAQRPRCRCRLRRLRRCRWRWRSWRCGPLRSSGSGARPRGGFHFFAFF